jgi:enoyl-CoA hydratase/carnithine racemase
MVGGQRPGRRDASAVPDTAVSTTGGIYRHRMFETLDEGPIRWLTITNPERRNAIPFGAWGDLAEAFRAFEASDARVLVVTGSGEDFCTGAELGPGMSLGATVDAYGSMSQVGAAAAALHGLTKPTVAAVDGYAVGAGLNLAIGCDVVVATRRARFAEIFVRRGLTIDFGGTWLLPRLVGLARAKELALTGRIFDAADALEYGLIARVVDPDELVSVAGEVAAELAAGAPMAQRFIKAGLDAAHGMSFGDAIAYERNAQTVLFSTDDFVEGVAAFVERRAPEFGGE